MRCPRQHPAWVVHPLWRQYCQTEDANLCAKHKPVTCPHAKSSGQQIASVGATTVGKKHSSGCTSLRAFSRHATQRTSTNVTLCALICHNVSVNSTESNTTHHVPQRTPSHRKHACDRITHCRCHHQSTIPNHNHQSHTHHHGEAQQRH